MSGGFSDVTQWFVLSGANELKFCNLDKKVNKKINKLVSCGWSVLKFDNVVFNVNDPHPYPLVPCCLAFV